MRRIPSLQLERAGFEVVAVARAEEVLDALSQRSFSAMVTDVCMPGLSGPELCEAIRAEGRHLSMPVVVITSRPEAECRE